MYFVIGYAVIVVYMFIFVNLRRLARNRIWLLLPNQVCQYLLLTCGRRIRYDYQQESIAAIQVEDYIQIDRDYFMCMFECVFCVQKTFFGHRHQHPYS